MNNIDELSLISGNDIPFPDAQLVIHQPRLFQIGFMGQQNFWLACEILKFNKESLSSQDKVDLLNRSNFNIIMTIIQEKSVESRRAKLNLMTLFALMFPTEKILLKKSVIQLQNIQSREIREINEDNFSYFQKICIKMFGLTDTDEITYNPSGDLAEQIANKIKQGHAKKNAQTIQDLEKIAILSRYVSILAVGLRKNIPDLVNYTVYQIMDEFKRFTLNLNYYAYQRYKIAGATGMDEPEDWFKDIYNNSNKNTNNQSLYI